MTILILSSCNPFPYHTTYNSGAVWSDDAESILYYELSYTESDFLAIDSTSKWDPEFTLKTINPDGTEDTSLGVTVSAWPESLYYMRSSGYVVYNYYGEEIGDMQIALYRLGSEENTILVEDAEPFDSEHIRVIPSTEGSILAVIEPALNSYGIFNIPIIDLTVKYLNAENLEELHRWDHTFEEYYEYKWESDTVFAIKDLASWDGVTETYTGFRINVTEASVEEYIFTSDYEDGPETSSSAVNTDGLVVSFENDRLDFYTEQE